MMDFFGENVDSNQFKEDLISVARELRERKENLYDLPSVTNKMSSEPHKYVFIVIYNSHASIVVLNKELFQRLFQFTPAVGQMINGDNLQIDSHYEKLAGEVTLQRYHVCLDNSGKYILAKDLYYIRWFLRSKSFFFGETRLPPVYLDILCLFVAPQRYKLIYDDCLEFAKRFVCEIATHENHLSKRDVDGFLRSITVIDGESASLEAKVRQNRPSALSVALSYFSCFRNERLCFVLIIVLVVILLAYIFI